MRKHEHSDSTHREVKQSSRHSRARLLCARETIATCLMAACLALLASQAAVAQTVRTWNVTIGTWSTTANWGGTAPTASDTAYFSGAAVGSSDATAVLNANQSALGLSFNNAGATMLRSAGTARNLTLGTGGIAVNSGAGAVTIGVTGSMVNLILNGTQTFTNNSLSLLSIVGSVNTASTGGVNSDVTIAGSGSTTISGNITGATGRVISVRKQGTGVLTLSGAASTYAGGFTLDQGTVVVGSADALGAVAGTVTINGGTLDTVAGGITANANPQTWNGDFAFAGSGALGLGSGAVTMTASRAIDVKASTLTVGGTIGDGGSGYSLTKNGAGTLRLNVANTFSGGVTLNSGTLLLNNNASLGTGTFTIAGGAIDVTAARSTTNNNAWNGNFTFVGSNTLDLGTSAVTLNATPTVTVSGSALTVGGVISGAGFGVTKAGAGDLRISGTTSTYTGATTINQGAIILTGSALGNGGAASPLGASSNAAANLILDGGTLRTSNAQAVLSTDRLFTMGTGGATLDSSGGNGAQFNFTNTGNIAFQGSGSRTLTLTSGATNRPGSFAPSLGDGAGGATSLVKSGANTWTVSGNLTFTGGVSITEGTLSLTGTQNNFSGGVNIGAAGTLGLDITGAMSFPHDVVNNGVITSGLTTGATVTLSGAVSGTGSINSRQVATFVISNTNNSYTGVTQTQGNASIVTISVSKLADGGQNSSIGASSSAASNLVLQNNAGGFASLTYTGAGDSTNRLFTITTSTANVGLASSGIVNNGSGPLSFTNTGAIAFGQANTVAKLELAGSNTGNNTFAPTIGDNGTAAVSFTKSGAGRWALTGNNTFTGMTTVSAGTLLVNGTNSGSGTVTVASGATLGGSGQIAGLVTVSGFLSPGNSPGVLTTGSLALQASSSTLIEIGGSARGTAFDGIDILSSGGLTYGGALTFDISALFPATSTLDVFQFSGSAGGSFSSVTATGTYGALTFTNNGSGLWSSGTTAVADTTITFNQTTGDVAFVIVPEPGAIALAAIGIAAAACSYRRRR